MSKKYIEAIEDYKKVLELDDTEVYAYNGIGDAKRSMGLYEEAVNFADELP